MMQFLKATPRLPVSDLARTIDFYIRTFGFHVASVWPKVAPTFVILENDNVEIQFYVPEGLAGEPSRQGAISFDVSDARAIHRSLGGTSRSNGGRRSIGMAGSNSQFATRTAT